MSDVNTGSATEAGDEMKTMGLYHHVDRVANELRELGADDGGPLDPADLSTFDQLHYHGTEAVDLAVRHLGIDDTSRVLEIGSGLGGPARWIAATTGATVTALELQEDHHLAAADLTARCGLVDRVVHVCGDALAHDWGAQQFDAVVSWLALYHIPDRPLLLDRIRSVLPAGGHVYVEDLCAGPALVDADRDELATDLAASHLPDLDCYRAEFSEAGFEVVSCDDMTGDWAAFTRARLEAYDAQWDRHLRVHGPEVIATLRAFYAQMVRLLGDGTVAGARLLARRT